MRSSGSSWFAVALAAALTLAWAGSSGSAAAASPPEDPSGAPAGYQDVPSSRPAAPEGRDDTLLSPGDAAPVAAPRAPACDIDEAPLSRTFTRTALWERLAALAPEQRSNARVEAEVGADAGPADRLVAARVSEAWGAGRFDEAIAELRALEQAGGGCGLAISWKEGSQPAGALGTAALAAGGTDVRIGTRTGGRVACLDYDDGTGYLFAVLCWGAVTGGDAYWTVHRSTDDGATWTEMSTYGTSAGLVEVSAAVVGGYLYVGYLVGDAQDEFRLRRCLVPGGTMDSGYGYQVPLNAAPATFEEICVVTNARSFDNRVYCLGIQSDDALRHAWDVSTDGTTFSETSTGITTAESALDASWNQGYAARFLFASYVDTDGYIYVASFTGSAWAHVVVGSASGVTHRTGVSVSAYDDNVICAYEYMYAAGRGIGYDISYDAGDTWNNGYLAQPDGATVSSYMCPDVDARDGHGTAIVYAAEVGEPDRVYYQKRAGFAPGTWEARTQFNDLDVTTGSRLALSPVPVLGPTCFSHGAVYFTGGGLPYFDLPMLGTVDVPPGPVATGVQLLPPAPSPFADRATVRFTLPAAGPARLDVFNVQGRHVATLAAGPMEAGTHSLTLDGRGLGSGVYFCRLVAGAARQTSRFVVVH